MVCTLLCIDEKPRQAPFTHEHMMEARLPTWNHQCLAQRHFETWPGKMGTKPVTDQRLTALTLHDSCPILANKCIADTENKFDGLKAFCFNNSCVCYKLFVTFDDNC